MSDESIDYKKLYEQEQKKVAVLEKKIMSYEGNGPAKLYYSLNRKQWEMADLMNRENLTDMDIDDPKSKTFDRLKIILKEGSEMGVAVNSLGMALGITGDEAKDITRRRTMTPESISDVLGNTAGKQD
jgi:hypothetical protein